MNVALQNYRSFKSFTLALVLHAHVLEEVNSQGLIKGNPPSSLAASIIHSYYKAPSDDSTDIQFGCCTPYLSYKLILVLCFTLCVERPPYVIFFYVLDVESPELQQKLNKVI